MSTTTTHDTEIDVGRPVGPGGFMDRPQAAAAAVPVRRMAFEEALGSVPRHFAKDGDLIVSHLMAFLSATFPEGEDYFVRSVRHCRDQITDPVLKAQVAGFIGQESVHGREHSALNDRLAQLGYPTKRVERAVGRVLRWRERVMPPEVNLAATAALEHFTACLAELALTDADFRALPGDPTITDIFVWHSLEEAEHKAVAFDVFRAVDGTEKVRIGTMKVMRVLFVVATTIGVVASLLGDRATYRRGALRKSWKHFTTTGYMSKALRKRLREYDRRGFHPTDIDTADLVVQWREELFGEAGSLNEHLVGAAPRLAS
jgi:predicted metal-dependent hydrolase